MLIILSISQFDKTHKGDCLRLFNEPYTFPRFLSHLGGYLDPCVICTTTQRDARPAMRNRRFILRSLFPKIRESMHVVILVESLLS